MPGLERREETIARSVHLVSAEVCKLCAHDRVVSERKLPPGAITKLLCLGGRPDDVREEDGREHAIRLRLPRSSLGNGSEELLEFGDDGVGIACGWRKIASGEFD